MPSDDILRFKIVARNEPQFTSLDMASEYFLTAKEAQRCSAWTLKHYRWTLGKFTAWLAGQNVTDASQITPYHIRRFLADLQRREMSSWTVHDFARVIKTWVRFLHTEELIPTNPMARVAMPKLDQEILPAFRDGDIQFLLDACRNDRDQAIVLFLLDTGVRASELCALNMSDVDLKTGSVMIRHGKGGKDRVVFLGARSRRALMRYVAGRKSARRDDPLFSQLYSNQRLAVGGLQTMLDRLGERAGVANCHPHTFRRTFALWSLRAGMNIFALQRLMGHSDLTVLLQYLAMVKKDLSDAHHEHGPVDHML